MRLGATAGSQCASRSASGLSWPSKDGLVVPGIHGAEGELGLGQIAVRRQSMVYCPQVGELRTANLADATFTISKLGMYGVGAFYAIQKPLQAAIPGVGRLAKRVIPIDGRSAVRATRVLNLSFDH